jgi:hypothetical protein
LQHNNYLNTKQLLKWVEPAVAKKQQLSSPTALRRAHRLIQQADTHRVFQNGTKLDYATGTTMTRY